MDVELHKLRSGCLMIVLVAAAFLVWMIGGYALVAGDSELPPGRAIDSSQPLIKTLAGAWLLSPVVVIAIIVIVHVRRRRAPDS